MFFLPFPPECSLRRTLQLHLYKWSQQNGQKTLHVLALLMQALKTAALQQYNKGFTIVTTHI